MASVKFSVEKSTSWILGLQIAAISFLIAFFGLPKVWPEIMADENKQWLFISIPVIGFLIGYIFIYNPAIFWIFNVFVSFIAGILIFNWAEGQEYQWYFTIFGGLAVFGMNRQSYQHMVIEERPDREVKIVKPS